VRVDYVQAGLVRFPIKSDGTPRMLPYLSSPKAPRATASAAGLQLDEAVFVAMGCLVSIQLRGVRRTNDDRLAAGHRVASLVEVFDNGVPLDRVLASDWLKPIRDTAVPVLPRPERVVTRQVNVAVLDPMKDPVPL
jgi:hypothetical protein